MSKTIVYLDQNFASNLGKARARRLADEKWLHLYEVLDDLVHNQQKVICPESFFHQTESSLSHELLSAINEPELPPGLGGGVQPGEDPGAALP